MFFMTIQSTHAKEPLIVLSILSLTVNLAVLSLQIYPMVKTKRNPPKGELYIDSIHYQNILSENDLNEQTIS